MSDEEKIRRFYEKMGQKIDLKEMLREFVIEEEVRSMFPPFTPPPKPMPLAVIPIRTYRIRWD